MTAELDIDCDSDGACVRSIISQISTLPFCLDIKNTPGLVGDHSASVIFSFNGAACRIDPDYIKRIHIIKINMGIILHSYLFVSEQKTK